MIQQVGRYTILSQLGRGGMGIVYLAEDPLLKRQVAIKTIDLVLENPSEREFMLDRLLRDARAAAMLSHPNVVCVHDVLVEGNAAYLVLEYIPGDSLSKWLGAPAKPDLTFALKVLHEVADALDYTHGRGVIHRDVKPANVMITPAGDAKIMDFGIARIADTLTSTPTGMVMGTVDYMSPEQIKGEPLDGRADQFSLAAMAYQMLTGATVFGPHTLATLTYKIVNESPPPASSRNPSLPPAVDAVLAKALSKLPQDRFASCTNFAAALESATAVSSSRPLPVETVPRQPIMPATLATMQADVNAPIEPSVPENSQSVPWVLIASVCVLISVVAALVWFLKTNRASRNPAYPAPVVASAPLKPGPMSTPPATTSVTTSVTTHSPVIPKDPPPSLDNPTDYPQMFEAGNPSKAAKSRLAYARTYILMRQFPEAVRLLSQAIEMSPDYPAAHLLRGKAYMDENQLDPAIADLSLVIQRLPQDANAYNERAICYVRKHDDKRAVADFDMAITLNPFISEPLNGRGLAHLRLGGYRKALADFDAAIRISPDFTAAYQNRARAKAALGDNAGAQADKQTADELKAEKSGRFPNR